MARDEDAEYMARVIMNVFAEGEVFSSELSPHSIQKIQCRLGEDRATAEWFSGSNRPYRLSFNGSSIPVEDDLAKRIVSAAAKRGRSVAKERLARFRADRDKGGGS